MRTPLEKRIDYENWVIFFSAFWLFNIMLIPCMVLVYWVMFGLLGTLVPAAWAAYCVYWTIDARPPND